MRTIGFMCLALLITTIHTSAHESPLGWNYPPYCCNGNGHTGDCAPIPKEAVKEVTGGTKITLMVGDHPMVTKPQEFFVPYADVKPSPDGMFHICLFPTEDHVRCFFAPDRGF